MNEPNEHGLEPLGGAAARAVAALRDAPLRTASPDERARVLGKVLLSVGVGVGLGAAGLGAAGAATSAGSATGCGCRGRGGWCGGRGRGGCGCGGGSGGGGSGGRDGAPRREGRRGPRRGLRARRGHGGPGLTRSRPVHPAPLVAPAPPPASAAPTPAPAPAPAPAPDPSPSPAPSAVAALDPPPTPRALPSSHPRGPASAAPSAEAPEAPGSDDRLAAERALVDRARAALGRGRPDDALDAVKAHEQRFPRGRLAEEREALAVQALARAGDRRGAEARAAAFHARWPASVFRASVDRALAAPP